MERGVERKVKDKREEGIKGGGGEIFTREKN